jgi:hypothetical protein
MKQLLFFCSLFVSLCAYAQELPIPVIPVDSATQNVTYQGVVQVPGASSDELYSRSREWFATYFNSGKSVLDMDDRAVGKLIGSGYSTFNITLIMSPLPYELWRTIKVYVREGRFRYEITTFRVSTTASTASTVSSGKTPVESYLGEKARKNYMLWDKSGKPKKMARTIILAVDKAANEDITSLSAAMAKPASKKDW